MSSRSLRWLSSALLLLLVACGASEPFPRAPFSVVRELASTEEFAVHVDVRLERDSSGQTLLSATYTPLETGFHLYSTTMARTGIAGAGRPTRLELPAPGERLRVLGAAIADQPIEQLVITGFDQPFPIYPEGPVTLRMPISMTGSAPLTATVSLTYMACSTGLCMPPMEDQQLEVTLIP